ncbi:ankyrin repeat and SOCS box protein 10 isoform X2 [Lepisosteus oculatus]|uniref:ankyrin repeat and SOCS box protein 10 isoform X2 n=1 Tax=Lepisosteus oculatus TaxID=7918 RepID=UPI0007403D2C|nr:PREDICTED: ankyrin repeat and SOCS box protein 10 isoform X2 [Lepisosteus oculatus]
MGPKKNIRTDVIITAKATGHELQYWNALLVGDEHTIISIIDDPKLRQIQCAIFDTSNIEEWKNYRFNYRGLRIWSLTYEQELTTPLHITAGRGYTECLKHLLMRGAEVDMAPGGKTALHEACENSTTECARLLLAYGGSANSVTEDGFMPLHLCTDPESLQCAKLLLQFGASVNGRSLEEDDTPLHLAARYGLPGHIDLYLRYGAAIERKNKEGQTPLNAACSQPQSASELEQYYEVCKLLVSAGADIHTCDQDRQTPLHMACKYANPSVVDLLLQNRANVNIMSYSGNAPMHNILKGVAYKLDHHPERIVRSLLNYGSIRVWPGALPKVLKYCCTSPKTIEVLLNTYDRLKITDSWTEAVPPEVFEEHSYFYESLFSLANTPRSLQHLARCKLRNLLEKKLRLVVSELGLPTFLQNYLLLDFRGYLH